MKNKLTMLLLALVIALGGTSVAMLGACDGCNDNPPPGPTEKDEYTVKFVDEKGAEIDSVTVTSGEQVTAPAVPEKAGYTGKWVDAEGNDADFTQGVTADATYTAKYTANTNTAYTVEYYYETVEGGKYEKDDSKTENLTGTTDTTVSVTPEAETGYEVATGAGEVLEGTITGDGGLVLKVYYNRVRLTVTFMADGATIDTAEVIYGATVAATEKEVPAKDKTEEFEYVLDYWSATEDGPAYNFENAVTENLTLYAVYEGVVRMYDIDVDLANPLYYFTDAEGNDAEFPPVEYGTEISFKVEVTAEATGTPVVKAVKTDDAGAETTETLTAEADGMYVVTVDKELAIVVEGLTARIYNVSLAVAEFTYEKEWAYPYDNAADVMMEVAQGDDVRTVANAFTGSKINLELTAGEYTVRAFVDEGGTNKYISQSMNVSVNSFYADEDGAIEAAGTMLLAVPMTIDTANAYQEADGDIRTNDGRAYSVTYTDFAPGSADFAVTVTYDQIMDEPEHRPHGETDPANDPSLGFTFLSGENKIELSLFDAGAVRIWENNVMVFEHRSTMAAAGSLMGRLEWPDCYRHATITAVKTGGWLYIVITADGNAGGLNNDNQPIGSSAKAYTEFVPMMIDLSNGEVYASRGLGSNHPSYDLIGRYTSSLVPTVMNDVTEVFYHFFFNEKQSWVRTSAYAYTTDAEVLAEYDMQLKSLFSIENADEIPSLLVDGKEYAGEEILTYDQTRKVTFDCPEGKVIDIITVGGEEVMYERSDNSISLEVSTFNNNLGNKKVVITFADGEYVDETAFTGKISVQGAFAGKDSLENVMVKFVAENGAVVKGVYNAADKTYTANLPAGNYTVYATNSWLRGTAVAVSGNAANKTLDIALDAYVTADPVYVGNNKFDYNAGLLYNSDGSYSVRTGEWNPQENAISGITFRPDKEILEFGWTLTGMNTRSGAGLYPFMGMFVSDLTGGMMRFVWAEAGDELRLLTTDHNNCRLALTDIEGGGLGGVQGWLPFGVPSGYYCFDKADYKLTAKVRIDGYNLSVWFKTGNDTEWKAVQFDDGTNTINVYDRFNVDTTLGMSNRDYNRLDFIDELYALDKECVFGISARRDSGDASINPAQFSDIWFTITDKTAE